MDANQTTLIRRKIMRLEVGSSTTVLIPGLSSAEIQAEATRFTKAKKLHCTFHQTEEGLVIQRIEAPERASSYPEIDALKVGQSHVFDLPLPMHQRVRLAASTRQRQGKGAFTCTREGDQIRVTRLPATEDERAACDPIQAPARTTKYNMERLSVEREIRFTVPRAEESKLRLAAHRQSLKTGWTIRCRLQDDGAMLVYRTDAGAPRQAAPQAIAAE